MPVVLLTLIKDYKITLKWKLLCVLLTTDKNVWS